MLCTPPVLIKEASLMGPGPVTEGGLPGGCPIPETLEAREARPSPPLEARSEGIMQGGRKLDDLETNEMKKLKLATDADEQRRVRGY